MFAPGHPVIFEIQNSNFSTLKNQQMSYQGHFSKFTNSIRMCTLRQRQSTCKGIVILFPRFSRFDLILYFGLWWLFAVISTYLIIPICAPFCSYSLPFLQQSNKVTKTFELLSIYNLHTYFIYHIRKYLYDKKVI